MSKDIFTFLVKIMISHNGVSYLGQRIPLSLALFPSDSSQSKDIHCTLLTCPVILQTQY